jgi:hypothetical protein
MENLSEILVINFFKFLLRIAVLALVPHDVNVADDT